jgi:hypothetical protein
VIYLVLLQVDREVSFQFSPAPQASDSLVPPRQRHPRTAQHQNPNRLRASE